LSVGNLTATVYDCVIEGFTNGAGVVAQGWGSTSITRTLIRSNGIGIQAVNSYPQPITVSNSMIVENGMSGVYLSPQASLRLDTTTVGWNGRARIPTSPSYLPSYLTARGGIVVETGGYLNYNALSLSGNRFQTNREHIKFLGTTNTQWPPDYLPYPMDQGGNIFLDPTCKTTCPPPQGGLPTVLCTALHATGRLSPAWYAADSAYAQRFMTPQVRATYARWAAPLARLLEHSKTYLALATPFVRAWAQHMAYVMGASEHDSPLGRWLNTLGVPLHRWVGKRL
jgi:hypothetical protein